MDNAVNRWQFTFNTSLPTKLMEKINAAGLLPETAREKLHYPANAIFYKNFFNPNGHMVLGTATDHTVYPAKAPWYTGAAIADAVVNADTMYQNKACEAAYSWLAKLTHSSPNLPVPKPTFNGLGFSQQFGADTFSFYFPDTVIDTFSGANAKSTVILIADSYENNDDWEKGRIPQYARQQALFQLWCWKQFAALHSLYAPINAKVVRICGNLPADCTIRTVAYNNAEAQRLVERICRNMIAEANANKAVGSSKRVVPVKSWGEKKQEMMDSAYKPDDPDLHEATKLYMAARSNRKQLENEAKEISDRMAVIALEIASLIPEADRFGALDLSNGDHCAVSHLTRRASATTISAETLRSFFPALEEYIKPGSPRKLVTIDAL